MTAKMLCEISRNLDRFDLEDVASTALSFFMGA